MARVAPLSDSTHKREVGKTLEVCRNQEKGESVREQERLEKNEAVDILFCFCVHHADNCI